MKKTSLNMVMYLPKKRGDKAWVIWVNILFECLFSERGTKLGLVIAGQMASGNL